MSPVSKTTFKDWQAEQLKDPAFVAADRELEPGYQITRLRILRGMTQAQPGRDVIGCGGCNWRRLHHR